MAAVIREVNNRKLPSFALLGESHVRLGAMAAIAPARNISVMARRVAINVPGNSGGPGPCHPARFHIQVCAEFCGQCGNPAEN